MATIEEKIYNEDNIDVTTCKCPNCKGTSYFDPKTQKMKCEYCGSIFDMPKTEATFVIERNLSELITQGSVWNEAEVYSERSTIWEASS